MEHAIDPREAATRWQAWVATGTGVQIEQMLARLDTQLPAGWRPLTGEEAVSFREGHRTASRWYRLDPTHDRAGVTLSLDRYRDTELRGGRFWIAAPLGRPAGVPAVWEGVQKLVESAIAPAARSVGAMIRLPTAADMFFDELPIEIRDRLRAFSEPARKSLPLDAAESDRWREFMVAAYRTRAVIDTKPFVGWLVSQGWPQGAAAELALRFHDQSLLLSRYAEEVLA